MRYIPEDTGEKKNPLEHLWDKKMKKIKNIKQ